MKERPILFGEPMVRSILGGQKTQTRRVVRKQFAPDAVVAEVAATTPEGWQTNGHSGLWWDDAVACIDDAARCPYGMPGDRLWVRETWQAVEGNERARRIMNDPRATRGWIEYSATVQPGDEPPPRWRPSIHMPRWASRITLEITDVRVERLNEISEEDARAEGVFQHADNRWSNYLSQSGYACNAIASFCSLWESINGAGSWDANPWVWAIEFRRLRGEHA